MFYILYEIRNNLNGKIYVGVHKTRDINDGYMGSGKVINAAIRKYGIENFTKTILEQFDNAAAMFAREKEVVTDEFLLREDTYNLRRGGFGGFDHINKEGLNYKGYSSAAERNRRISPMFDSRGTIARAVAKVKYNEYISDPARVKIAADKRLKTRLINNTRNDASQMQTPSARLARKVTFEKIQHQKGLANSQSGTMWITNGTENRKIKITDPVPESWSRGRILNK